LVHNDFEKYAFQKSFDLSTDKSWDKVFYYILKDINIGNRNIKFLDYGCGDGKYFKKLISLGLLNKNIHGVEVSKNRIKRCHAINFKNAIIEPEKVIAPIEAPKDISIKLASFIFPTNPRLNASGFKKADIATNTAANPTKL